VLLLAIATAFAANTARRAAAHEATVKERTFATLRQHSKKFAVEHGRALHKLRTQISF
jgi:hypothetical protein